MEQIRGGGSSGNNDEIVMMRASLFESLPKDCMSMIIAHTSPRDACVVAMVSKKVNSAAQSNVVWEKFIPPEYASFVPRPLVNYSSKKEIYLSLADDSVLIDDGKKSFWLEKSSGKKCYMLSAMDLTIIWGDLLSNVKWFEKVAMPSDWIEIRGRISCGMLSKETHYSVYAVFQRARTCSIGFDNPPLEARVGFVGKETTKTLVLLESFRTDSQMDLRGMNFEKPKERRDGWCEVDLGKFYVNNNGGGCEDVSDEIEISIVDIEHGTWKYSLVIQGIEIRPER